MAKRSAKSKGFRKQAAKKPYLSKKEIVALCVIVAVLAVGAFFLFRYDDGALKVRDGAVVAGGDNWLIVDGSNVRGTSRYFKVGEIGEIDGYSREKNASLSDPNVPDYVFTAGEGAPRVTASCTHTKAEPLATYARTMLENIAGNEMGELQTADVGGQTVRYYIYTSDAEAAEAANEAAEAGEEAAEAAEPAKKAEEDAGEKTERFVKTLAGYVDAAHDSSVVIHVESRADALDGCAGDEALTGLMEKAVGAVTLEEQKK